MLFQRLTTMTTLLVLCLSWMVSVEAMSVSTIHSSAFEAHTGGRVHCAHAGRHLLRRRCKPKDSFPGLSSVKQPHPESIEKNTEQEAQDAAKKLEEAKRNGTQLDEYGNETDEHGNRVVKPVVHTKVYCPDDVGAPKDSIKVLAPHEQQAPVGTSQPATGQLADTLRTAATNNGGVVPREIVGRAMGFEAAGVAPFKAIEDAVMRGLRDHSPSTRPALSAPPRH
eukprot:GFYU01006932.1.p1 GENE.GFYU01006932.1~~GFYU01006932.1.p1  ORF type:complete len:224 (+),score=56.83 GFYU01006932.1:100-771(+)